ncbi:hypothetical protein MRX96_038282 [Rhipicephalus microplus]
MYSRGNPLPLRHRRPQLCTEMEAAAATREWSPVDVTPLSSIRKGLDERDPASAPILLTPGSGRRRKGRRITWPDEVPIADVVSVEDETHRSESYLAMWILAMLAVLVLLVIAVYIVWLWAYLHERRGFLRHGVTSISANEGLSTAASAPRAVVNWFTRSSSGRRRR